MIHPRALHRRCDLSQSPTWEAWLTAELYIGGVIYCRALHGRRDSLQSYTWEAWFTPDALHERRDSPQTPYVGGAIYPRDLFLGWCMVNLAHTKAEWVIPYRWWLYMTGLTCEWQMVRGYHWPRCGLCYTVQHLQDQINQSERLKSVLSVGCVLK